MCPHAASLPARRERLVEFLGHVRPWAIADVQLTPGEGVAHFHLALPARQEWVCPECLAPVTIHDYAEREWRHMDLFGLRTFVHSRVPRLECTRHGIRRLPVPWAGRTSRFTTLFETFAYDLAAITSVNAMATRMGLSRDEAQGIVARMRRVLTAEGDRA